MNDKRPLEGKVAIVTGGNSGIGASVVLELARQGANLTIDYVVSPAATEALEKKVKPYKEKEGKSPPKSHCCEEHDK